MVCLQYEYSRLPYLYMAAWSANVMKRRHGTGSKELLLLGPYGKSETNSAYLLRLESKLHCHKPIKCLNFVYTLMTGKYMLDTKEARAAERHVFTNARLGITTSIYGNFITELSTSTMKSGRLLSCLMETRLLCDSCHSIFRGESAWDMILFNYK